MPLTVAHAFVSSKAEQTDPTLVGPNEWNANHVLTDLPLIIANDYVFTPQTPGGTLTAGITNTVTLAPVPSGINATDTSHRLYISGGTGTAEAVLITGGTAVGGASSGTITFVPVNNHSGAWSIATATAGILEALWASGGSNVQIFIQPGTSYKTYAPISIDGVGVTITGAGTDATSITDEQPSGNTFSFNFNASVQSNEVGNLTIVTNSKTSGWVIFATNQNNLFLHNLNFVNPFSGIEIYASVISHVSNINMQNLAATGIGILIDGPGPAIGNDHFVENSVIAGNLSTSIGIQVNDSGGSYFRDIDVIETGYGFLVNSGTGKEALWGKCTNCYFDTCLTAGIAIEPNGGIVAGWRFENCWSSTSSGVGVFIAQQTGQIDDLRFVGHRAFNNTTNGFAIGASTNVAIEGASITGNSTGSHGTNSQVLVTAAVTYFKIINSNFGGLNNFTNVSKYNIEVAAGASDHYVILGNTFYTAGQSGNISDSGTGVHKIIKNNEGVDDVALATLASATSIALPVTNPAPNFYISGTTATTTFSNGWIGRILTLIKTDTGSLTVGGGGNIPLLHTMTQNTSLTLTFDGTNWY